MLMTHKELKTHILKYLGWINEMLGTNYQTTYYSWYGGWNLYMLEGSAQVRGALGFDYRISSKEMLCYLEGIYYTAYYLINKPKIGKEICDSCL